MVQAGDASNAMGTNSRSRQKIAPACASSGTAPFAAMRANALAPQSSASRRSSASQRASTGSPPAKQVTTVHEPVERIPGGTLGAPGNVASPEDSSSFAAPGLKISNRSGRSGEDATASRQAAAS